MPMVASDASPERRRLLNARKQPLTEAGNTEAYDAIADNPFENAKREPLSTFAANVDTFIKALRGLHSARG